MGLSDCFEGVDSPGISLPDLHYFAETTFADHGG